MGLGAYHAIWLEVLGTHFTAMAFEEVVKLLHGLFAIGLCDDIVIRIRIIGVEGPSDGGEGGERGRVKRNGLVKQAGHIEFHLRGSRLVLSSSAVALREGFCCW